MKKCFLIIFALILITFVLSPIFVFAQESKSVFDAGEPPALQMPIPGTVEFSKIKVEGGTISVPWLAEYIAGIYKYAIALAVTLAIFMVMVGGFLWITAAGDKGKIGKATEIITDAVVGLILAVGSYVILYTINPDILEFKALQVGLIKQELWTVSADIITPENPQDYVQVSESETEKTNVSGGLYDQMLSYCLPKNQRANGDTAFHQQQFVKVVKAWASIAAGKAVYVKGGRMGGETCNATNSDTFLNKAYGLTPEGSIAYREWAKSMVADGGYCADCGTFAGTIINCVKGKFYNPQFNTGDAIYKFSSLKEFIDAYQNGTIKLQPGDAFWMKGSCPGHAITYTGGKSVGLDFEMIEMGGYWGPRKVTSKPDWNGQKHPSSIGTKKDLITDYLQNVSNKYEKGNDLCKVWIMRPY